MKEQGKGSFENTLSLEIERNTNIMIDLPNSAQRLERSLSQRILFGFLWFLPFSFLYNMVFGCIVSGIVGAYISNRNVISFNFNLGAGRPKLPNLFQDMSECQQAVRYIYDNYGNIVFIVQILLFASLCFFSLLPGVGRYKAATKT
jgi:hypothetical protein